MIDTRNRILRVVEEDVDGCGSDAVDYVMFSKPVNDDTQELFQNILRDVKANTDCEDYDTDDMVEEAVERFNASEFAKNHSTSAEVIGAPYYGVVTF